MSMIFGVLVVTLLLAVVIVNTLDAHEEAQKEEDDLLEIQQTKKYIMCTIRSNLIENVHRTYKYYREKIIKQKFIINLLLRFYRVNIFNFVLFKDHCTKVPT